MNRIVSLSSVAAVLSSFTFAAALSCVAVGCAPVEEESAAAGPPGASPASTTIAAPAPEPVVLITCVTNSGDHQVTEEQCKKLLTIAGCKPGAVVGDKMKCSTTSSETRDENPDDFAAPAPEPIVIKCITNTGEHDVTEEQCKKLLTIAGCKPGAVVNDTMKCSTSSGSTEPPRPPVVGGPDDLAAPEPTGDPTELTCVTNAGEFQVTEEQCKKLLTIAGCKPGAVVGDKMKCSTT